MVELFHCIAEGDLGIGVAHVVERLERRETDAYPIRFPYRAHGVGDFKHQPRAILEGAAIGVTAVVAAVAQELVEQIAIGAVDFHAVESRLQSVARTVAILLDDAGDLG